VKIINDKQIDRAYIAIDKMTEKQAEKYYMDFNDAQPHLFSYLIGNSEEMHNEDARDDFIFIISVIWECYEVCVLPLQ